MKQKHGRRNKKRLISKDFQVVFNAFHLLFL